MRLRFSGGRVTGVDAIGPGGPFTMTADHIVLCAGAIESAHLLMLSGVGDETMLRDAGVDVVEPLPVGMACSDHPEWVLPTTWAVAPGRPALEVVLSTPDDLEIRPYTGGFVAMVGDGTPGHPDWPHLGVALMRPRSRGRVTLVSADPSVPPIIEHRYDSEPADIAALREGCRVWPAKLPGRQRKSASRPGRHRNICAPPPRWARPVIRWRLSTTGAECTASMGCG